MRFIGLLLTMTSLAMGLAQDGEAIYNNTCLACHQATGEGMAAVFPPLAKHVPALLAAEGGRDYLIKVVAFGLMGPIEIDGQTYNGAMPGWPQLNDEDITALLNYLATAWGNEALLSADFEVFQVEEVTAARAEELTQEQVLALREGLVFGE